MEKVERSIEIIENQLYWHCSSTTPKSHSEAYFIQITKEYEYVPFFQDFGPINLGQVHSFCFDLDYILKNPKYAKVKIYIHTPENFKAKANSIFLICSFQIIMLGRSALDSFKLFTKEKIRPYRDASKGASTYNCTIMHCLQAIEAAIKYEWYNPKTFDIAQYKFYEKVENGDMTWIFPRLLALCSPCDKKYYLQVNFSHSPEYFIPHFKKLGVTLIIRLNSREYDKSKFLKAGFKHLELQYPDGSTPSDKILNRFLVEIDKDEEIIAMHCLAGLGRTGTLAACYAMYKYKIPASVAIAWVRICRPGSIIGCQQHFLLAKQQYLHNFIPSSVQMTLNTSDSENAILESLNQISKTPNGFNLIVKPHGNNQNKKSNNSQILYSQGTKLNSIKIAIARMNNK